MIAYTRKPAPDYSEFLGHSVHFAVASADLVEPLYMGYGKLFAECSFSEENGVVSRGCYDVDVRLVGGVYIITAREIVRTNHGRGEFSRAR